MRRWAGRLVAVLLLAPLGSASAQRLVRPLQDPALRPGDVLRINVWRHAELSGDFVDAPDSTLVDPVYQVVKVAGVPLSVVRERLRGVLSTYEQGVPFVVEPVFPVTVAGELRQPNLYRLREGTTFAQAIAQAGLVVGVVAATVVAAGVVAYVTGPAYRAVAVIRMSDPRRALTGGVVLDPARADERFSDPLLSQAELLTSRAVAGAVVDSMPARRMVTTRDLPLSLLGEVAVPAAAGPVSLQITFGRDSVVVRGTSGRWSAPYGSAVDSHGIRFAVLHRPDASTARLKVLSREAAITRLLARLRVKPRLNTDIVDVTYSAPDPSVAQHVLNQVVDIFKSASAEDAQQQSTRRREFLESQLKVNDSLLADA